MLISATVASNINVTEESSDTTCFRIYNCGIVFKFNSLPVVNFSLLITPANVTSVIVEAGAYLIHVGNLKHIYVLD